MAPRRKKAARSKKKKSSDESTPFSIVSWYNGNQRDRRNRHVDEVLRYSDDQLEHHHNFIQFLFPLPWPSKHDKSESPIIISPGQLNYLRGTRGDHVRKQMLRALQLVMRMFNLEFDSGSRHKGGARRIRVVPRPSQPTPDYLAREEARNALANPGSHHHARFTRIIRSLRLLGRPDDAISVYRYLRKFAIENSTVPRGVARRWGIAANAPDPRVDPAGGVASGMDDIIYGVPSDGEKEARRQPRAEDSSSSEEEEKSPSSEESIEEESAPKIVNARRRSAIMQPANMGDLDDLGDRVDSDDPGDLERPESPTSEEGPEELGGVVSHTDRYTGDEPRDSDDEYPDLEDFTEEQTRHHRILRDYEKRYGKIEYNFGFRGPSPDCEWLGEGTDPYDLGTEEVYKWEDALDNMCANQPAEKGGDEGVKKRIGRGTKGGTGKIAKRGGKKGTNGPKGGANGKNSTETTKLGARGGKGSKRGGKVGQEGTRGGTESVTAGVTRNGRPVGKVGQEGTRGGTERVTAGVTRNGRKGGHPTPSALSLLHPLDASPSIIHRQRLSHYPLRMYHLELNLGYRSYDGSWKADGTDPVLMNPQDRAVYAAKLPKITDDEYETIHQKVLEERVKYERRRRGRESPDAVELDVLQEERNWQRRQDDADFMRDDEMQWITKQAEKRKMEEEAYKAGESGGSVRARVKPWKRQRRLSEVEREILEYENGEDE